MKSPQQWGLPETHVGVALAAPPRLLLDCIPPPVRGRTQAWAIQRSFTVLHRVLTNLLNHPGNEKYAKINLHSHSWTQNILPYYFPLCLQEWLGAVPTDSGTHLELMHSTAEDGAFAQKHEEVEAMTRAWISVDEATSPPTGEENIASTHTRSEVALQQLLLSSSLGEKVWESGKRLMRWSILRNRLNAMAAEAPAASLPCQTSAQKSLVMSFSDTLAQCVSDEWQSIGDDAALKNFCDLFDTRFASVVSIPILEDCQSVVDAAKGAVLIATTRCNEVRQRVAARHCVGFLSETRQALTARTGEAYRRLSMEEQQRGVALILDIAAFMEQVAIVEESQTMIRKDRIEAQRLLHQFAQDGDLVSLHGLRDLWEEKLEAAKIAAGKQVIFLS